MRTFDMKPKTTLRTTSPTSPLPGRAYVGQYRGVNSILALRRTIGNQKVERPQQANADRREAFSDATASGRFDHDFSRIAVHAIAPVKIQSQLPVRTPGDMYEEEADRISEQVLRTPQPQLRRVCPCGGAGPMGQTKQTIQKHAPLQTKLNISSPDDKLEREADAMANRVHGVWRATANLQQPIASIGPDMQTTCAMCEKEGVRRKPVMTKSAGVTAALPGVEGPLRSSKGEGHPLPRATLGLMEEAFGVDFSAVRVHVDCRAEQMNQGLNALAFTHGTDIYFNRGQYQPSFSTGKHLLAHELTHVIQQSAGQPQIDRFPNPAPPPDPYVPGRPAHNHPALAIWAAVQANAFAVCAREVTIVTPPLPLPPIPIPIPTSKVGRVECACAVMTPRDRSINFCKLRTFFRSPAFDAVKMRCLSRRTSSSTCRQSIDGQSRGSSSGPFTTPTAVTAVCATVAVRIVMVSNLPFGTGAERKIKHRVLTGSPNPRQHPFRSGISLVRPVIRESLAEEPDTRLPGSRCLSAAGVRFSGRPASARELGLPHGRLTRSNNYLDPIGVVTFCMSEIRPGRVPSGPRRRRCTPD